MTSVVGKVWSKKPKPDGETSSVALAFTSPPLLLSFWTRQPPPPNKSPLVSSARPSFTLNSVNTWLHNGSQVNLSVVHRRLTSDLLSSITGMTQLPESAVWPLSLGVPLWFKHRLVLFLLCRFISSDHGWSVTIRSTELDDSGFSISSHLNSNYTDKYTEIIHGFSNRGLFLDW